MKEQLQKIREQAISELQKITDLKSLDDFRVNILGKKGELTKILKGMGSLSAEERPIIGQLANDVRILIETRLDEAKTVLSSKQRELRLLTETIDVTMPGRKREIGHKHPMTRVIDEIKELFLGMGFQIVEGPEVEYDLYNFELLNIPSNHPTKDEQDTFYINENILLRTQTSSVQARVMKKTQPPIRVIAPGKVFRSDEVDATHSPVFHQCEGLVVDEGITMGDLKGALHVIAQQLFGANTSVRFRPSYFPFTEPSAEMDVSCYVCGGDGCRVCKATGWIEVLGCGMVHPNVLKMCGIDPDKYSGYAFGMGLERFALSRYEISDMRLLFENDVKFLKQF